MHETLKMFTLTQICLHNSIDTQHTHTHCVQNDCVLGTMLYVVQLKMYNNIIGNVEYFIVIHVLNIKIKTVIVSCDFFLF